MAPIILVTGNATIRSDGALVMGRGAAQEAQRKFPGINKILGYEILRAGDPYGVVLPTRKIWMPPYSKRVGVFQVKHNYWEDADLDLISISVGCLLHLLDTLGPAYGLPQVAMNFPGIGWGRLRKEDVLPIISELPDSVEVWEK